MAEKKWDRKGNQVVGGAVNPVPGSAEDTSDDGDEKPSGSASRSATARKG